MPSVACATWPTPTGKHHRRHRPGHTGKGADFRLAEMAYKDYPGIYHMIEIPPDMWALLPDVPEGRDSVNLDPATERILSDAGFLILEE